ncbi:MAG: alpha/beta hydrolase [Acidobacteriota bacterium]
MTGASPSGRSSSLVADERGSPTSSTTVFIHGAGVGSWMWRGQLTAVPDLHCLVLDLPGHGQNHSMPWTSIPELAGQIADLIRDRTHGGRAHIVGLSLGAVIGLELVANHPDVVDRAMLTGLLGTGIPGAGMFAGMTRALMPLARLRPMISMTARALKVPAEDRNSLANEVNRLDGKLVAQVFLEVAAFRPPSVLAQRTNPVLILAGSREYQGILATVRTLLALLPNGAGGLVPAGIHTWNWQFPDLFNRMLRDWLIDHRVPEGLLQP